MLTNIGFDVYYCSMTVQQAYQQLVTQLTILYERREAAAMANLVVERVTGFGNSRRILNKDVILNNDQQVLFENLSAQLVTNKPLQYVLNEAIFFGLKLYVNESVLIPRPETEELVEWIIKVVNSEQFAVSSLLDVGTGSGCIPIALKKILPLLNVSAIDVSAEALAVAKKNAAIHQTEIHFSQLDILNKSFWQQLSQFDCIVSNPPYIARKEADEMHKNVLQYEPQIALFVQDEKPLLFYETIALFALQHLNSGGYLFFEINELYGKEVSELLMNYGYKNIEIKEDLQGKNRMIKAQII